MAERSGDEPGDTDDGQATRHDGGRPDDHRTRRDRPRDDAGATRHDRPRDEQPGDAEGEDRARDHIYITLPPPLSERFEINPKKPDRRGAEGIVVVVHDREADEQRVLKLYHPGIELDREAVDSLLDLSADPRARRHIVTLYEVDQIAGGPWYEVQEYCAGGSLRTPEPRSEPIDAHAVAEQLGRALTYLQGRLVFRDIKPANIMLRSPDSADIVLGDFGLVRTMAESSEVFSEPVGTPYYLPPEAAENRLTLGWDWWSFGMVLAEHALGRHPLAFSDGEMPRRLEIPALIRDHPIDLSGIEDERLRTLCQGLLLRDYRRRWRAEQVQQWLTGANPSVPADVIGDAAAAASGPEPEAPRSRVQFARRSYTEPEPLAAAFQDHWRYTLDRLVTDRDPEWVAGLEAFLRERELSGAAQTVARMGPDTPNPSKALAGLLLDMSVEIQPVFDGLSLTPEGLRDAAEDVLAGRMSSARLEGVRQAGVLDLWWPVQKIADGREISHQWDDGAHEIDRLLADLATAGTTFHRAVGGRAKAWILLTRLGPKYQPQLEETLAEARDTPARGTAWWQTLAAEAWTSPAAAALAVVTVRQAALMATERTARDELSEQEDRADAWLDLELERLRRGDTQAFPNLRGSRWWWSRRWGNRLVGRRLSRALPYRPGMLALVLGGGLVAAHVSLLGAYEAPLREYFASGAAPEPLVSDSLGTLDQLSQYSGLFAGIAIGYAAVVLVGASMVARVHPANHHFAKKVHHVVIRLAQLALVVAVVGSGLIDVLLSDAAAGYQEAGFPAGFLPDWGRAAGAAFVVIVVGAVVAAVRAVLALGRSAFDTYP